MTLVSSCRELVQQLAFVMTAPTFATFAIVLTGWVFGRRHTVTGVILATYDVTTSLDALPSLRAIAEGHAQGCDRSVQTRNRFEHWTRVGRA